MAAFAAGVSASTLSITKSWIAKRTRDKKDERVVRISLTEQGRSLKTKAAAVPEEIAAIMAPSSVQIEEFHAALINLRDGIRDQSSS